VQRGPEAWATYRYVRIEGECMAPVIREGAWVGVDATRPVAPGDVVVVREGPRLAVAALAEWLGQRWLASAQCPARPLDPAAEIVGVVALIIQQV